MHTKMNSKHFFITAVLLLALIGMPLIVKGSPEQVASTSNTEIRNFVEIPYNTPELFKRVCGMHSFKCGRRRSSVIKVKKPISIYIKISFTRLPNNSDPYRTTFSISYIFKCSHVHGYMDVNTLCFSLQCLFFEY